MMREKVSLRCYCENMLQGSHNNQACNNPGSRQPQRKKTVRRKLLAGTSKLLRQHFVLQIKQNKRILKTETMICRLPLGEGR